MKIASIIAYLVPLIIVIARVNKTQGRISRNRYWKISILMITAFVSFCLLMVILLYTSHITLLFVFGYIGNILTPLFVYYYTKFEIQRLRDFGLSDFHCVLSFLPVVGFYYLYVRFVKKRRTLINEYDESLDYSAFVKNNRNQLKVCFIESDGINFFVNGIKFEYRKNNDHIQYEVSTVSLEEDKALNDYCKTNLTLMENSPSYMNKYRVSFLDEGSLLKKIRQDLHAIVLSSGYITINGVKFFIRKNCGLYEIIYDRINSCKVKQFSDIEEIDGYCCQSLNKHQLIDLLNENCCSC